MFMILVFVSLLIIGLLAFSGRLSRFGRLPGDIEYRGDRTRIYAPITSMLLLSLLLSLVLALLSWLF